MSAAWQVVRHAARRRPPLDAGQPGVGEPVPPQRARQRQQVEVAGVRRRRPAVEAEASDEQRPVEGSAVVRDEPGVWRDERREVARKSGSSDWSGKHELAGHEALSPPTAQTDDEGQRARVRCRAPSSPCRGRRAARPGRSGPAARTGHPGGRRGSLASTTTMGSRGVSTTPPPRSAASRAARSVGDRYVLGGPTGVRACAAPGETRGAQPLQP